MVRILAVSCGVVKRSGGNRVECLKRGGEGDLEWSGMLFAVESR